MVCLGISHSFIARNSRFDSLAIGMTYGMARITIPILPRILQRNFFRLIFIAMLTAICLFLVIARSDQVARGGILILLGIYTLWRTYQQSEDEPFQPKNQTQMGYLSIL